MEQTGDFDSHWLTRKWEIESEKKKLEFSLDRPPLILCLSTMSKPSRPSQTMPQNFGFVLHSIGLLLVDKDYQLLVSFFDAES